MHNLNVRIFGPSSFISTLNELKIYLKFNPLFDGKDDIIKIILFHTDVLQDKNLKNYICKKDLIKICVGKKKDLSDNCDASLELPTTIKEINAIVENTVAKKRFNINSSIEIKDYFLNKNEKKLAKLDQFIILTEKEIQLLELFLKSKKPISKDNILSSVWNYSSEADTHTVETHIYRLRKKINDKFIDDKFILNNKEGYYL
jgi:hypothetical protein